MKNEQLVLNTLVYADQIKAQELTQLDVLEKAKDFGLTKVEVRRELFADTAKEIAAINQKAAELGLEIFYSIPEGLFIDNQVNPMAGTHIEEAKALGATHAKWNLGEFAEFQGDLFQDLDQFDTAGIELNVENDQSASGGTLPAVLAFGERFLGTEKLGLVYDLGNWSIMGFDPVDVAEQLKPWVRYIHLKDVADKKVVPLGNGELNAAAVMDILPQNLPIAFEFRVKNDAEFLAAKDTLK